MLASSGSFAESGALLRPQLVSIVFRSNLTFAKRRNAAIVEGVWSAVVQVMSSPESRIHERKRPDLP